MKTKIFTIAELPTALAHAWLQHLRNFDVANPDCHFEIFADSPDITIGEVVEIVKIHPELSFQEIFKKQTWK